MDEKFPWLFEIQKQKESLNKYKIEKNSDSIKTREGYFQPILI